MRNVKLVSIITPVFNESLAIDRYFKTILNFINKNKFDFDFEIIITDNCSSDDTFEKCKSYAKLDPRIKIFRFIKNYGYQKSIFFGYSKSSGDCVMQLDCDLQDPLTMLSEFIEFFKKGYEIVYGIRVKRKESKSAQFLRKIYYRLVNFVSEGKLPNDAGDFMLVGRKGVNALKKVSHQNIYVRGEIFSLGLKRIGIPYTRDTRIEGESKFKITSLNLLSLAKDGLLSQSTFAIRISVYFSFIFFIVSIIALIVYLILKLNGYNFPDGYVSIVMLLFFITAINSFFFSIIGEYIYRIYSMLKDSSECIIQDQFNVK